MRCHFLNAFASKIDFLIIFFDYFKKVLPSLICLEKLKVFWVVYDGRVCECKRRESKSGGVNF